MKFNKKLTNFVSDYGKPVLLVHGDHHKFIFDRPLRISTKFPGVMKALPNFYRLQVYGAPEVGAIKVGIDTELKQPFSISPLVTMPWEY